MILPLLLDSAESYLNECLAVFQTVYGPHHQKTIEIQDELARLMIRTDRAEVSTEMWSAIHHTDLHSKSSIEACFLFHPHHDYIVWRWQSYSFLCGFPTTIESSVVLIQEWGHLVFYLRIQHLFINALTVCILMIFHSFRKQPTCWDQLLNLRRKSLANCLERWLIRGSWSGQSTFPKETQRKPSGPWRRYASPLQCFDCLDPFG